MQESTAKEIYENQSEVSKIIGDFGGETQITGDIYESSTLPGFIVFETEHGSLYIDEEQSITFK